MSDETMDTTVVSNQIQAMVFNQIHEKLEERRSAKERMMDAYSDVKWMESMVLRHIIETPELHSCLKVDYNRLSKAIAEWSRA